MQISSWFEIGGMCELPGSVMNSVAYSVWRSVDVSVKTAPEESQ
jgi:hypothetical protein